jgi:hypothetical protein
MKMKEYFEGASGNGILATSNDEGRVNAAVYGKPHFMDDDSIAFIMLERRTHHNLQSNPHAAYLFLEKNGSNRSIGVRFYLTKIREEKNSELLIKIRRVKYEGDEDRTRYLVFFKIDGVLPLIGAEGENPLPFERKDLS